MLSTSHDRFPEAPREDASKTLRAAGTWTGRQQTRVAVRDFTFTVDEPERIGGRDEGPTPMEYLAGSVGACITVVIDQLAQRHGLELTGVHTYALARQDQRGLAGTADVQPYFHTFRLQVCIGTPQTDPAVLRQFAADVEHSCPAVNLLRDAHVDLEVAWSFAERTVEHDAEATCNAACGYEPQRLPQDAPEPVLTLVNADAPSTGSTGPAVTIGARA